MTAVAHVRLSIKHTINPRTTNGRANSAQKHRHEVGDTASPPSTTSTLVHSSLEPLHSCTERLDDIANVPYFVVLRLEIVDGPEDFAHLGDFPVSGGDRAGRARGRGGNRAGCLGIELRERCTVSLCAQHRVTPYAEHRVPSSVTRRYHSNYTIDPVLNSPHQALEMTPQHSQAPHIQHQSAASMVGACGAGGPGARIGDPSGASTAGGGVAVGIMGAGAPGIGEGDLLVLTEDVDFGLGEAELGVGDGGGDGGWH